MNLPAPLSVLIADSLETIAALLRLVNRWTFPSPRRDSTLQSEQVLTRTDSGALAIFAVAVIAGLGLLLALNSMAIAAAAALAAGAVFILWAAWRVQG
jgi:hypothetical protein